MTKASRPYSRVYWEARDDSKFRGIWTDDRVLGCWVRLLVAADMAYPASADLYHGINRKSLDVLVKAGLVDLLDHGTYRIHGLDRERSIRSRQATEAAHIRHGSGETYAVLSTDYVDDHSGGQHSGQRVSGPNAKAAESPSAVRQSTNGTQRAPRQKPMSSAEGMRSQPMSSAERMPSQDRAEQSKDEQSRDETQAPRAPARNGLDHDVGQLQLLAEQLTQTPYVLQDTYGKLGAKAVALMRQHGRERLEAEWRRITESLGGQATLRQLVLGSDDALNPIPGRTPMSAKERAEAEKAEAVRQLRVMP